MEGQSPSLLRPLPMSRALSQLAWRSRVPTPGHPKQSSRVCSKTPASQQTGQIPRQKRVRRGSSTLRSLTRPDLFFLRTGKKKGLARETKLYTRLGRPSTLRQEDETPDYTAKVFWEPDTDSEDGGDTNPLFSTTAKLVRNAFCHSLKPEKRKEITHPRHALY